MMDYKRSVKEELGNRQKLNKRLIDNDDYFTDDITINRHPHLRTKSSDSDEEIANFDDNLEKSKDDIQAVDKKPFNTDIENKVEHERQEFANFHEDDEIYKGNARKSLYETNREEKKDINAKTKTTNENINKEKLSNLDENGKIIKLQTDHNRINTNDLKILENIKHVKGILRRNGDVEINTANVDCNNIIDKENGKCWFLEKFQPKLLIGKVGRRKCGRRSKFDDNFVTVMTNVLNKYVDTAFRFTDEMTTILLENIFAKNTDLRNNIFDVNKLLKYLRKSVHRHKTHSHKQVITLKSRHCLTLSMPGCFCKSGFVENSGQCVKPEDCVTNENYLQYLTRIVVL